MKQTKLWLILMMVVSMATLLASTALARDDKAQAPQGNDISLKPVSQDLAEYALLIGLELVDTNIGSEAWVWGGGDSRGDKAQVRLHMRFESKDQYQFNFEETVGIIRDGDGNPTGVELRGRGIQSGNEPFEATAKVDSTPNGLSIFINGKSLPSIGLQFETEGTLIFEKR